MDQKSNNCIFCDSTGLILHSTTGAIVVYDAYPVTRGHLLVYPKKHIESLVDVLATLPHNQTTHENMCGSLWEDMSECIEWAVNAVLKDESVDGVNVGVNVGKAAGQVVMHCHFHVIPRYLAGPRRPNGSYGGVRHAVPDSSDLSPEHDSPPTFVQTAKYAEDNARAFQVLQNSVNELASIVRQMRR